MALTATANTALAGLPHHLRDELLACFDEIITNYRQRRWEPSELNGGKLCEVTYCILRGLADKQFPPRVAKPRNIVDACRALEATALPRAAAIQIPRMLIALYEIRNNRGVGHAGGEVNPNHMDATCVVAMSKWIVAELVRFFHGVDTKTATAIVDDIVAREVQLVWNVAGRKRVLKPDLTSKDKALLLLYSSAAPVSERELVKWVEHSNPTVFRRDVLMPLHRNKLIEYDKEQSVIHLSPSGIDDVEKRLI